MTPHNSDPAGAPSASSASDSAPAKTPQQPPRAGRDAWWTVIVLTGLYVFSYLDRFILTMLVPSVKASLKLSDFQMGLILGPAFAVVFAISGIPLGWAADRYSRRIVIVIGALIFGIATGVSGLATSFAALLAMRILVGIGEASLTPAAMSLISDKMPRERLTTAISIFSMGPKIGSSAAYAIGGLALAAAAAIERSFPELHLSEPWRLTLGVAAIPSALVALLVFTFSEPPRTRPSASKSSQGAIAFMKEKRRLMIPLILGFCCVILCGQSLIAWVPTFIARQFHWSPAAYGPILGIISLAGAATLVPKGMIIDWLFARGMRDAPVRFYTWLLMGTLPLAMSVFLISNATLFLIFYSIVAVVTIPLIAYFTTAAQMVTPTHLRGRVTAIVSIPLAVVGGLGPLIVGALTDFLFQDEARLGWSLALVLSTMIPAGIACMRYCLPALREAVDSNRS